MRYYLIAGEASGDLHGSNLMRAIIRHDPHATFRFCGGDLMQAVGGSLLLHYRHMAYMGFIPVLTHLATIIRNMQRCKADIIQWKPDVLILIDYPGFNLDIAKYIHQHTSIPVYYYIAPKLWAWKQYRIKNLRRDIDALFSILPFEVDYFRSLNYHATYVGNPCADAINAFKASEYGGESRTQFAADNHLDSRPIIALLAGSRRQEIRDNLRIMLAATRQFTDHQVVVAGAPGIEPEYYKRYMAHAEGTATVVYGQTYRLLQQTEAALVTSGTATLETALMGVPQVVCYYTACGHLVSWLRGKILKVKYISLVNLICNRPVVTELVAADMTQQNLTTQLEAILPGSQRRQAMLADYDHLRTLIGNGNASDNAARAIIQKLK